MKANYELHEMKDRRLPFIFHNSVLTSKHFAPNWHENIEILIFTEGSGTVRLDEREYTVNPGDTVVVNTGCIHNILSSFLRRYCLIVDNGFCEENGIDITGIEFAECFADEALTEAFHSLSEDMLALKTGAEDALSIPTVRHKILGILLHLCRHHVYDKGAKRKNDPSYGTVRRVIRYLQGAKGRVSLDQVAAHAHISKFHLSHEFKRITGSTVFEYLNVFRCESAARLLRSGMSASEAAAAVGFDNLSYFSRTFKRYVGMLPSACKK